MYFWFINTFNHSSISPLLPFFPTQTFFYNLNRPHFCRTSVKEEKQGAKLNLERQDLEKTINSVQKRPWNEEEDKKLQQLFEQKKMSWSEISAEMGDRTYKMCYSRYKRIKLEAKKKWTKKEDEELRAYVQIFGKQWKHFPQYFPGRTSKQLRERYLNSLRPQVSNEEWTVEQDLKLVELINRYGRKWKKIESEMKKRSQNQLKNRYFSRLLRLSRMKKGRSMNDGDN